MKIVLASHNLGKLKEFKDILEPLGYELLAADSLGVNVEDVNEDGETFAENALKKAKYVYEKVHLPVISDDSGLVLKAYPELLSVHSARYMADKPYSEKMKSILSLYDELSDRAAYFQSVLVYYDEKPHYFEGRIDGTISKTIKGQEGFGYDPIFIPNGHEVSFAEMTLEEKQKISHRGIALEKFVKYLKDSKL